MTEISATRDYQIQVVLNSYSGYSPDDAVRMLVGKRWRLFYSAQIDNPKKGLSSSANRHEELIDGEHNESYTIGEDGTVAWECDCGFGDWRTEVGKWSFDPATKRLTLLDNTFYLEAVSPEVMVLQEVIEYLGAEPAYIRLVYIVQ